MRPARIKTRLLHRRGVEKLDAIVAAVGGVILVVAIVGAALSGTAGTSAYDLTYADSTQTGSPIALQLPAAGGQSSTTFTIPDENVTSAHFKAYVNSTLFPSGASSRIKVTSPNGRTVEKEATTGVSVAANFLGVEVDLVLGGKPSNTIVQATDEADAFGQAAVANATGTGDWLIEVSWAPVGPVPPQSVTGVLLSSWTVYSGQASPHIIAKK